MELPGGGQEMGVAQEPDGEARHLTAAIDGFVSEIKSFRADITRNLKQYDERLTMLDRKFSARTARPALSTGEAGEGLHLKAFDAYLRSGDDDALRG